MGAVRPVRFEFARKATTANMRMPAALLRAIRAQAAARGVPHQRLIGEALEPAVGTDKAR
jgi:predicted DNA binding CopG/RHH family protein